MCKFRLCVRVTLGLTLATLATLVIPLQVIATDGGAKPPLKSARPQLRYHPWPFRIETDTLPRDYAGNNLSVLFKYRRRLEPERDEYETSQQFLARLPSLHDTLYAFKLQAPEFLGHDLSYDADAESLTLRLRFRVPYKLRSDPEAARTAHAEMESLLLTLPSGILRRDLGVVRESAREILVSQDPQLGLRERAGGAGTVLYVRNWKRLQYTDSGTDELRMRIGIVGSLAKAIKSEWGILLVCRLARDAVSATTWMEYSTRGMHRGVFVDVVQVWWYVPSTGVVIEKQLVAQ